MDDRPQVWQRTVDFDLDGVAVTKPILEMLYTTQTTQFTVDHDSQSGTQRLAFFHAENESTKMIVEITEENDRCVIETYGKT